MRSRCINILAVLFFIFSFSSVAYSSELDDGVAAYDRGEFAVAIKKFRKLAEQGNAFAQAMLGVMYYEGEGVPHDYKEAVKWWRKAAEQGIAFAQINLGAMYANGIGVPQDYVLAYVWLNLAAYNGEQTVIKGRDAVSEKNDSRPDRKSANSHKGMAGEKGKIIDVVS